MDSQPKLLPPPDFEITDDDIEELITKDTSFKVTALRDGEGDLIRVIVRELGMSFAQPPYGGTFVICGNYSQFMKEYNRRRAAKPKPAFG